MRGCITHGVVCIMMASASLLPNITPTMLPLPTTAS